MVALGKGTESRAAERARESLGKRVARQLESLSPTKLGARLSLAVSPTKLENRLSPAKHRASLSGYPSLTASPTASPIKLGERMPPTKHRARSRAKPESRQHDRSLSPTKRERSHRVRTSKRRSADLFDC